MALCVFDKPGDSLRFAGAGLPLYVLSGREFQVIRGDRRPIGYRGPFVDHVYAEHVVTKASARTFYLATDGYLDEGGGEKGFCFGEERFQSLVLELADTPLADQAQAFQAALDAFRGDRPRRDDITVAGFRFPDSQGGRHGPVQDS